MPRNKSAIFSEFWSKCNNTKHSPISINCLTVMRRVSALLNLRRKMNISEEGKNLIKKFEGCELEAYKCAAGVWTIGYGHIKTAKEGMTISQSYADELFDGEIVEYEDYVNTAVTVPLSQNQFDAIVSWVFNLGNGNLRASTMLKVINSGDHAGVPAQIKRWNKAGGKVLEGLVRRREAEALLYEGKEWSHV